MAIINLKNKRKMRTGFTLIEMLVVVTIIAVISATLGLGMYQNSLKKSRDGRRKADLENIRSGLEMYRADVGSYPPTGSITCGGTLSYGGATYISPIPCDPKHPTPQYIYTRGVTSYTYSLTATLEAETPPAYTRTNP